MLQNQHLAATKASGKEVAAGLFASAPVYLMVTLLVAGFLANAAIVLVGLPHASSDYSLHLGDLFDLIAKNLDQGNGYRVEPNMGETMLREPGYPLLIAAVFKLGGYGDQGPRLACILLAFGAALVLLQLTRKITGDRKIALIAALLFLVYPTTLVAEARAGNEMLCVLTTLLFILALYLAVENGSVWRFGVAGALLGVAALVRSEVLLFPLTLPAYFLFTCGDWEARGKAVLRMVALTAGVLVATSPWIIRNYLLLHQFVPTSTLGGVAAQEGLYTCEHLSEHGSFAETQRSAGRERAEVARRLGLPFEGSYYYQFFYTPQDEVKFNHALLSQVSERYRSDPGVLVGCAAENVFFKFWFLGRNPRATRINMLVQLPLLVFALGGLIVLHRVGLLPKAAIALLYAVYIPIVHAPIIAHARHSTLVVPFLAVPAAAFLAWAWHALRAQHSWRQQLGCGGRRPWAVTSKQAAGEESFTDH